MSDITKFTHPNYNAMSQLWAQLIDCYDENIKAEGTTYLPKTSGMIKDTALGATRYLAYNLRANYINYTLQTVTNSVNTIKRKNVRVASIPDDLMYLKDNFNSENENMESVLYNILKQQMKLGRVGYLVDFRPEKSELFPSGKFEAVEYKAPSILNWGFERRGGINKLVYVLLQEESQEISDKGVEVATVNYRILGLDSQDEYFTTLVEQENEKEIGVIRLYTLEENNLKQKAVIETEKYKEDQKIYRLSGISSIIDYPNVTGKFLHYIPFFVANADDTKMAFSQPPLLNQSNLSLGVYNASANHEALIYLQTANMMFISGSSKDEQGNSLIVDGVTFAKNPSAKAYYVGVDGAGLSESRANLNELKNDAASSGTTIQEKNTQESEKSLQSRIQLQSEKLKEVSKTGAEVLQSILRTIAEWSAKSKTEIEEIEVVANVDFRTEQEKATELDKMIDAWKKGGITDEDLHNWQVVNNYTKKEYKEWIKEIEKKVTLNNETINDIDANIKQ